LRLEDHGVWDPDEEYCCEEGEPLPQWVSPIIARGPHRIELVGGRGRAEKDQPWARLQKPACCWAVEHKDGHAKRNHTPADGQPDPERSVPAAAMTNATMQASTNDVVPAFVVALSLTAPLTPSFPGSPARAR
jgi:hypothetical protein